AGIPSRRESSRELPTKGPSTEETDTLPFGNWFTAALSEQRQHAGQPREVLTSNVMHYLKFSSPIGKTRSPTQKSIAQSAAEQSKYIEKVAIAYMKGRI